MSAERNDPIIEETASAWLARRDRGLTRIEQDDYLQWLQENPAHGRAIAHLERTWAGLDLLTEWRPEHSNRPNPDLLSPRRDRTGARPGRLRYLSFALAGAAAVALAWVAWRPSSPRVEPATRQEYATVIGDYRTVALADGSTLELNTDTAVVVENTSTERNVRLLRGEALFTVAKDATRPFVVRAGPVGVRAVGTAFNVRLQEDAIEVIVTEGTVNVETQSRAGVDTRKPLVARQRALVPLHDGIAHASQVVALPEEEIERMLAWRDGLLEFLDTPLPEIVAAFNRHNRNQVLLADDSLLRLRMGGSFRADNVEAFVRLLSVSYGVNAEILDDGRTALRRVAPP